jgi:phosphoserine phosphatase
MKYVIFDLDGTLADIELRRKKALKDNGEIHWGVFFDPRNIDLDSPVESIVTLYHVFRLQSGFKTVIFSGRSDITKDATEKWFRRHYIVLPDIFIMRRDGDFTPDQDLKKQWLEELLETEKISKNQILFVVDDRNKVVNMWREEGLTCLHCAEGDF